MQENKALRFWKWSVVLLVLCNIALIITLWAKPQRGHFSPGSARDFVITNLKFSDAQVKSYDVLISAHRHAMNKLQHDGMEYRKSLFTCLCGNRCAGSTVDSVSQLIAANQKQIELVTYSHFQQVRNLCTAEQKTKFDDIIVEVMRIMNSPGHGGPPPGAADQVGAKGAPGDDGPPPPGQ